MSKPKENKPTRETEASRDYELERLILTSLNNAKEAALKKKKKAKNPIKKALKPC